MSDDKEKLLEIPEEERERLEALLCEWIRDVVRVDDWGCWSNVLGSYKGTEVEELFDEVLMPLQTIIDDAECNADNIPSSMWLDENKHKEIVKEWKDKKEERGSNDH